MVAKELVELFDEFNIVSHVGVDDFSDKLTFLYTLAIHLVCILIVTTKNYVSSPISCYISTTLSGDRFDKFITNYCWVHGTIPLFPNETTPENNNWDDLDATRRIAYYQWVPFVLGLQAILAYLPRLLWQALCQSLTGTDVETLLVLANKAVHSCPSDRRGCILQVAHGMADLLADQRRKSRNLFARLWNKLPFSRCLSREENSRIGFGLRYIYLVVKILYLANALMQLYFMQWFLGFHSFAFGFFVLKDLLAGADWRYTMHFPRVTYCNTREVRFLGSQARIVAQCALPINMLNEKIFLFLWFWYTFLFLVTTYSLLLWLVRILYTSSQVAFVRKYLRFMNNIPKRDYILWRLFTKHYLRGDGVFLVRMIKTNAGDLLAKETVEQLWCRYREEFMSRDMAMYTERKEAHSPHHRDEGKSNGVMAMSRRPTLLAPHKMYKVKEDVER